MPIPRLCALSPMYYVILRFTYGATPADLVVAEMFSFHLLVDLNFERIEQDSSILSCYIIVRYLTL